MVIVCYQISVWSNLNPKPQTVKTLKPKPSGQSRVAAGVRTWGVESLGP